MMVLLSMNDSSACMLDYEHYMAKYSTLQSKISPTNIFKRLILLVFCAEIHRNYFEKLS